MKALVYTGPKTMAIQDVPEPVPGPGEALIRVEAVGICGSDMHAWKGHDERRPPPLTLGHEAAGVITSGPEAGRRVTINPLNSCGACDACTRGDDHICPERKIMSMPPRQGAFSDYVAAPLDKLVTIPDDVPADIACLAEPMACCWHAVRLGRSVLNRPLSEAVCLVQGGGAIGLGSALVLAAFGARRIAIAETNTVRHPVLRDAGPFDVFTPGQDPEPPSPHLIIDAVGIPATREAASRIVAPGGVIVHIGLGHGEGGLETRRATLQEIAFLGSYCYTAQDFRDTAAAIFAGRLGSLDWAGFRALEDGVQAFNDLAAAREAAPKIVLRPDPT